MVISIVFFFIVGVAIMRNSRSSSDGVGKAGMKNCEID